MKDESASFISERPSPSHASSSDLPAFILPTFRPSSFILHPSKVSSITTASPHGDPQSRA
ncbi:MAG: hypothetical protein ACXWG4_10155 [Thermoanaerobaculia bacterium]